MLTARKSPVAIKARILVVDDEPGIRDLLRQELQMHGYAVETASDGREAVEKIEKGRFQMVQMLVAPGHRPRRCA